MEQYCLYLRKSRADADAEARGEGETHARHEKALLDLARRLNLSITHIHREIVSGETIAARPVMQQLLSEVEQGVWTGVLVMEVERLARGDTIDQGIVAQTFKFSDTKIITPLKTFDPANEYDEEYFEFGLFMSRREYKTINRRLQRGRMASVQEGKWVMSMPPYGYERVRLAGEKGWTLAPIEHEAEVVRMVFDLYTRGELTPDGEYKRIGVSLIVRRLNKMGVVPRKGGKSWSAATVRDMLMNPVYVGKIRWNWRKTVKHVEDGHVVLSHPRNNDDVLLFDGRHPALVDAAVFELAQEYLSKNPPRPIGEHKKVASPLAGLIVCGKCGKRMIRRPKSPRSNYDVIMCADSACNNVGVKMEILEERLLDGLADWLSEYRLRWDIPADAEAPVSTVELTRKQLLRSQTDVTKLEAQLSRTHDLLEQGVYDVDMFLARSRDVTERLSAARSECARLSGELEHEELREKSAVDIIPAVEKVLELYHTLPTPRAKNDLLKEVLEKVVYVKEKSARWKGVAPDDFEITIFPKIPKSGQ